MRPLARPSIPRRTVRLRLTLVYGALFLVCGAALLTFTYVLMAHATNRVLFYNSGNGLSGAVVGEPSKSGRPGLVSTQVNGTPGTSAPPDIDRLRVLAERQRAAELHQLLLQSGIALAVMAVISIGLGWLVAGRVLRPLRTIATAVRDISATNLHQRLALSGPDDELKELGNTFDALLARLDASFQGQRRFVANASHELRTPLARQRTLAQVALDDPRATVESLRAAHERVLAAGTQQERLIEALLTLARTEAGLDRRQPVDLAVVTARVLADLRPEAQLHGLHLDASLEPAPTWGDPRLIERLVANLADNALRHNIDEGSVHVGTGVTDGAAVLCVINTGPLVPATDVDRLFQPFQRIGAERTGHGGGVGLGLSIVKAVADTHEAGIVAAARPDGGLRVEVTFALRDDAGGTAAELIPVGAAAAASPAG